MTSMELDPTICYQAVLSRDPRFDATDVKYIQLNGQVAPPGGNNAAAGIVP